MKAVFVILTKTYGTVIPPFFNRFLAQPSRLFTNRWVSQYLHNASLQYNQSTCVPPVTNHTQFPGSIDLTKSPLVNFTNFIASNVIGANGPLGLNRIMDQFTRHTGIVQLSPLNNLTLSFEIPLPVLGKNISFEFGIVNGSISGLNTWQEVDIIRAISPHVLLTHASLEGVNLSVNYYLHIISGDRVLKSHGENRVITFGNDMNISVLLALNESQMASMMMYPNNFTHLSCIYSSIIDFSFDSVNLSSLLSSYIEFSIGSYGVNNSKAIGVELNAFIQKLINSIAHSSFNYLANYIANSSSLTNQSDCPMVCFKNKKEWERLER